MTKQKHKFIFIEREKDQMFFSYYCENCGKFAFALRSKEQAAGLKEIYKKNTDAPCVAGIYRFSAF